MSITWRGRRPGMEGGRAAAGGGGRRRPQRRERESTREGEGGTRWRAATGGAVDHVQRRSPRANPNKSRKTKSVKKSDKLKTKKISLRSSAIHRSSEARDRRRRLANARGKKHTETKDGEGKTNESPNAQHEHYHSERRRRRRRLRQTAKNKVRRHGSAGGE